MRKAYVTVFTLWFIAASPIFSLSQSGGIFVMQKSVIASGGSQSAGGAFTLDSTIGESFAGTSSSGGTFGLTSGFWGGTASPAANVTISGRVFASDGMTGLRNAGVRLTDSNGIVRTVTTSSFGFYAFDNVAPGFSYTIRIVSRRFRFQPQTVTPSTDLTGVDFTGLE